MATIAIDTEYTNENDAPAQKFEISNGDLAALKEATEIWGVKDEASLLRFALAILTSAKPGNLSFGGNDVAPGKTLLKETSTNADQES